MPASSAASSVARLSASETSMLVIPARDRMTRRIRQKRYGFWFLPVYPRTRGLCKLPILTIVAYLQIFVVQRFASDRPETRDSPPAAKHLIPPRRKELESYGASVVVAGRGDVNHHRGGPGRSSLRAAVSAGLPAPMLRGPVPGGRVHRH